MDRDTVITASNMGRRFGLRWALRGVTVSVSSGEMLGIVGPDGAGKTTLLQMCAAILDPSEGECRVFGYHTVTDADQVTSRIGYMSQGFTLYDRLTVSENLRLSARLRDVSSTSYAERSERLLDMAGLAAFVQRSAGKLSGGMRKKLALCTNLIHEPRLLLLDEPGMGVDPLSRRQLWSMLETFRAEGVTILVATSYMEEAERCDRVLLLEAGETLELDTPAAIRHSAEGLVFEIVTDEPESAAQDLERLPGVYGIHLLPDRLRFQRVSSTERGLPVAAAIPVAAHSALPTLEDVFVLHAGPQAQEDRQAVSMPNMAEGAIDATRVSVDFGDFRAVDGVSLFAGPRSLLALLGPNGAGKTTLIRALCGLVPISEGEVRINGSRVQAGAITVLEQIGYMSQHFSLYPDLTLDENLSFFASAYAMRRKEAASAIDWARSLTGLTSVNGRSSVAALSGATRQRLALACGILHRPSVLFLDEPTSGVDPLSRYRFWRLIRTLASSGMAIVVTTHYLNEAEYCDRIGLMHEGRLIALGSLPDLRRQSGSGPTASVEDVFTTFMAREDP